jgi:hypothetical protein
MTRVGMVDLSTSHPGIFAPLLAGLGMPVTAVLESDESRVRDFGDIPAAGGLAELAGLCDVVMLLGPDWDQRLDQVSTLAALGVPVFVDKPMGGTAGELAELARLADGPARIDGGSALRVAPEALAVRGQAPSSITVTCGGHPFYYGVHAVALAVAVLGPGLVTAHCRSDALLDGVIDGVIEHVSGVSVRVAVSGPAGGFRATVGDLVIEPAAEAFYPALLADVMTRLTSAAERRPGRELVECELALLAMAWSAATGGAPVRLDEVPADFRPWRRSS